ncbi:hypothetical protein BO78DRAFT_468154 [Aspergillus sclerotiicarbonarius CBS 121057]|uniref:Uncharacterized protein n=1 Tax=Aspergillus sclerotiicarbonarius (strain CBS 121057 / IBT 28362) TaxID=1448318 RepID=A0A319EFA2_ASPSB|nr:hypothetical protein BO78DRAFT_468154 [Aspergillus sclerotiicarbonarius CBS 121057]
MPSAQRYRAFLADYDINESALNVPRHLEPIMPDGIRYELNRCLHMAIQVLEARERYRPRFDQMYAERFDYLCSAEGDIYEQHKASVRAILSWTPPMKIPKNMIHLSPFGTEYDLLKYRETIDLVSVEMEAYSAYRSAVQKVEDTINATLAGETHMAFISWLRTGFLREMRKWEDGKMRLHMPDKADIIEDFCRLIRERVEDGDLVADIFSREANE